MEFHEKYGTPSAYQHQSQFHDENNLVALSVSERESRSDRQGQHSFFENMFNGFFHNGVEESVNGVTQFANHSIDTHIPPLEIVDHVDRGSIGGAIGEVLGDVAKVGALAVGTVAALPAELGVSATIAAGAITGAALGMLSTEKEDGHYWHNKVADVLTDAGTGAVFAGASRVLAGSRVFEAAKVFVAGPEGGTFVTAGHTLLQDMGRGTAAGAITGFANSELDSLSHRGSLASASDTLHRTLEYAAIGGAGGILQHGVRDGFNRYFADRGTRNISSFGSVINRTMQTLRY